MPFAYIFSSIPLGTQTRRIYFSLSHLPPGNSSLTHNQTHIHTPRYSFIASSCASTECDPLNPRIPTQIVGSVTYLNYGADLSAHTLSTIFTYAYQYYSGVDPSTGDATSGPKEGHAGLTGVYYGMFDITSGTPQSVSTGWISSGCESGTISAPLMNAAYQCNYTSSTPLVFRDNTKYCG